MNSGSGRSIIGFHITGRRKGRKTSLANRHNFEDVLECCTGILRHIAKYKNFFAVCILLDTLPSCVVCIMEILVSGDAWYDGKSSNCKIEMVRLMVRLFPIFYFQSDPYISSSFYPLLKLFPIYAIRTISVFAMQSRIANSISNVYYLCLLVQYI